MFRQPNAAIYSNYFLVCEINSIHLVIPEASVDDAFLEHVCDEMREKFKIGHSTIQIERGDGTCMQEPEGVV